jgi:hypothetical protein
MIAAALLCTVLAVFSISRQLSVVADTSRKQQAEEALRTSFPSKAFCARVSPTRRNIDSTAVAAETPGTHTPSITVLGSTNPAVLEQHQQHH